MSRRRTPPPSAIPGRRTIRVVCTDKGQHPEVSFGTVVVWPRSEEAGGGLGASVKLSYRGREWSNLTDFTAAVESGQQGELRKTDTVRCRRCGRRVRLVRETLERIGREFYAAGLNTLDLADL